MKKPGTRYYLTTSPEGKHWYFPGKSVSAIREGRKSGPVVGFTNWTFDGWIAWHQNEKGGGGGFSVGAGAYGYGSFETERAAVKVFLERLKAHREAEARLESELEIRKQLKRVTQAQKAEATARVEKEFRRICRAGRKDLPKRWKGGKWSNVPDLTVRWSPARKPDNSAGHAWGKNRVTVTISMRAPWYEIVWLLTHELAHCVPGTSPWGSGRARIVHGPNWQAAFCRLAEKAHKVECWAGCEDTRVWSRTRGVDRILRDALAENLKDEPGFF